MRVGEKVCKTALSRTGVSAYDYTVNPYTGCQVGCRYCYAAPLMRRFTGHVEPWGSYVDVKVNLAEALRNDLGRARRGVVWLSSVTDPYQPLERRYGLTRKALEMLVEHDFPVSILTKSDLVLRDKDILKKGGAEVGFSISTFDETARRAFEPAASPAPRRIDALKRLSEEGISTWAFISPVLPHATEILLEELVEALAGAAVKRIMVDRFNPYGPMVRLTIQAYGKWRPGYATEETRRLLLHGEEYYEGVKERLAELAAQQGVPFSSVF